MDRRWTSEHPFDLRSLFSSPLLRGFQPIVRALQVLGIRYRISEADLRRIPAKGAAIVVANHPFGAAEGLVLGAILRRRRPDGKILANHLLARMPELREALLFVDPFGGEDSSRRNRAPLREALRWVEASGLLAVFPAGEAASGGDGAAAEAAEAPWNEIAARLLRRTQACAVPVFFPGSNGTLFRVAGRLDSRLRTAFLPRQLLNKGGRTLEVRVGLPVPFEALEEMGDAAITAELRARTFLLSRARDTAADGSRPPAPVARPAAAPLAPEVPWRLLRFDVERLTPEERVLESGAYRGVVAAADRIPHLLTEIARLREKVFREVGEGTGRSLDRDAFDDTYLQVAVVERESGALVAACRIGRADEILRSAGVAGLYTSTMFRYGERFLGAVRDGLEIGRTFVARPYQRSPNALFLLWKTLGRFVTAHPNYAVLFGAVSVSERYDERSRRLLVAYLRERAFHPELSGDALPRHPFVPSAGPGPAPAALPKDLRELSRAIAALESDGKGVPVLFREYLKLGARFVSFGVDPGFGNSLDGLVVVDLRRTDPRILRKVFGEAAADHFLALHAAGPASLASTSRSATTTPPRFRDREPARNDPDLDPGSRRGRSAGPSGLPP